jgi:nicotinamidase-related amidase
MSERRGATMTNQSVQKQEFPAVEKAKTALIIIDYQNDIVKPGGKFEASGLPAAVAASKCIEHTALALDASRASGVRVVFARVAFRPGYPEIPVIAGGLPTGIRDAEALVESTWGSQIIDELAPLASEVVVTKHGADALCHTDLDHVLRARGISHLVLAGVATNNCVEATARHACDLGYLVTILEDCCTSFSEEWHCWTLNNVLPQFATISDSQAYLDAIRKR